jgi:FkbM family methyltransferase
MNLKYNKFHGNDLEDKYLFDNFTLPPEGVFVDIGCGPDGIQGSNSYFFEQNGWKVVCVDPEPRNTEKCKQNRQHFYPVAITSTPGKVLLHQGETPDTSGLSVKGDTIEVDGVTLESILEKENIDKIDIISIDTEGTELDVWKSFDWKKHKPTFVICEAVTSRVINNDVIPFFQEMGYNWIGTVGPNLLYQKIERKPLTVVYGSSYDRGLEHLLNIWADVKKAVPEAKLRVFYGWNLFDVGYKDNPERMAWKDKINKLLEQDGITHLNRIGHEEVKREFESAGVWAYPTHFGEISCITAMKAQTWGAVPVVIDYAALHETVQFGVKIDGDIYDRETKDAFRDALIDMLKDTDKQEKIRAEMMPWARDKFSWANVAKQWSQEFQSEKSIEKQVEELMDDNQPLKAWELVKDLDNPIKDKVYSVVRHAFDYDEYKRYYSKDLIENPIDEQACTQIDKIYPRFGWLIPKLQHIDTLVDLGCADGYLPLTAAAKGIESTGINLYQPSVDLANERAKKLKLRAKFICQDIFEATGTFDAVVMFEILEHLPDPQAGVDKAMSLLADDGTAYFSTPRTDHVGVELHKAETGRKSWDSGEISGHLRLFTEQEFRDLFKAHNITELYLDAERCMCVSVKKK